MASRTKSLAWGLYMNYLIKHWEGKLPLTTAFWINTVVINIFLLIATLVMIRFIKEPPTLARTIILFNLFVTLPIAVWQIVGLWRTCDAHVLSTQKSLWPNVVRVLIVIGVVSSISSYKDYHRLYKLGFASTPSSADTSKIATKHEDVESSLLSIPAYVSIKKYEPQIFNDFKNQLQEKLNAGASSIEIQKMTSDFINKVAVKALPKTSDKALLDYTTMIIQTLRISESQDPLNCIKALYPEKYGVLDESKTFTEEQLSDILRVLDVVVIDAYEHPYTGTIDKAKVEQEIRALAAKHPDMFKHLNTDNLTTPEQYKQSCDAIIGLYQSILDQGGEIAPMTLRYLFSQ